MDDLWLTRGATGQRPTLFACSGCGYSYWSHGDDQDPRGDGHCSGGFWIADERALAAGPEASRGDDKEAT